MKLVNNITEMCTQPQVESATPAPKTDTCKYLVQETSSKEAPTSYT